jgi:hypothetical protein
MRKKIFYFLFTSDGKTDFEITVEGKDRKDAEKRLIENFYCCEQVHHKNLADLQIEEQKEKR